MFGNALLHALAWNTAGAGPPMQSMTAWGGCVAARRRRSMMGSGSPLARNL